MNLAPRRGGHRFRVPDQPGAESSHGQATSTSPIQPVPGNLRTGSKSSFWSSPDRPDFPPGPIYKAGLLVDLLSSLDVQEASMPQSGGLLRYGYFHRAARG